MCWGSTWCQDYYSYSESGQAPPVTVWPTAVPTLDSVSPSSGSGSVQTFTAQYSSAAGGDDITEAWLWLHTTTATSTYSCLVRYIAASHSMALENDAATAWTSAPVGAGPPPQNSQCLLNTLSSTATVTGHTRTVSFTLLFQPSFAGPKNVYYLYAFTRGANAGWQDRGDFTMLCPATLTPTTTTVPAASGNLTFWIATGEGCQWSAPATSGFLTLTSPGSGSGSGQVSYAFSTNASTSSRTTQPTIAGQVVTVTQIGSNGSLPDEDISYYHLDAIGSVRMVTDANGSVLRRHDFLPFGQEWQASGGADALLFTGQEREPASTLDYFGARYYTSSAERFTTPDPLALTSRRLLNPRTLNRYAYAANNPLRYVDITGLEECPPPTNQGTTVCGQVDPLDMQDVQMQLWRYWAWLTQGFFGEPPYVPVIDPNPQPVVGPPPKSGSHQVRCFEPTWYQKVGIKAHQFVARRVNQPIGIGFGGTVSAGNIVGITASISHQMVVFPDGSGGLATTVAFPGLFNSAVSPGASAAVGVQLSTTNAASLRDLSGYSLDYGVTAGRSYGGAIDLALTQADARTVWQGTLTLGGAAGLVGHGGVVTLTAVQPFCGN